MKRFAYCFIVTIILSIAMSGAVFAQETDETETSQPLLELLSAVPAALPDDLAIVSFADVSVAEQARFGNANMVRNAQQFEQITDVMGPVWLFSYPVSGLPMASYFLQGIPLYQETMGFELFDIDQSIYFGNPPTMGYALLGNFDNEAIIAAHEARDFTVEVGYDIPVLCGPNGCEEGQMVDPENRSMGNLFGGHLGRTEPLALGDGLLMNSADFNVLNRMIDLQEDSSDSIANLPTYLASANAITQEGALRQAMFVPMTMSPRMTDIAATLLGSNATAEQIEQLEERLGLNEERDPSAILPPYQLLTFADVVLLDDDVVHSIVGLAYPTADDAEHAAGVMQARLDAFDETLSMRTQEPFADLFEARDAEPLPIEVYEDEETGFSVVLLSWESGLIVGPQENESGQLLMSSPVFRVFLDMLYARDTAWLAVE